MMSTFIAKQIMKKRAISLEEGQNLYRAYFLNTSLYLKWKSDVDSILQLEDCGDCIVTE